MKTQQCPKEWTALCFTFGTILLTFLPGCVRSNGFKNDRDFYQDTGDGYYKNPETLGANGSTPETTDHLERLRQPKKRTLILSFWNDTPVGDTTIGDFAAEELKRQLYLKNRVIYPDENSMATTKDFLRDDEKETIQITQLIREGKRAGVSTIIIGRISKIVFRENREEVGLLRELQSNVGVDVEIKTFDVAGGREVMSAKRSGFAGANTKIIFDKTAADSRTAKIELAKQAVLDAITKLIPDAMLSLDKMDWQGRVAKILGNKVYINAGRQSGLLAGDILKVLSPGEEIIDPITKAYLGRSEGLLKGTLEVTEFIGEDSAMALIHTGGNFQDGDVVSLY